MLSLIALRANSIIPSMLAHAVNNGCLVALAQLGLDERINTSRTGVQIAIFLAATAVLAAGAVLVATTPPTGSQRGEAPNDGGEAHNDGGNAENDGPRQM